MFTKRNEINPSTGPLNGGDGVDSDTSHYILATPGYDLQLGHLVSIMNYTRSVTVQIVRDLMPEQLDNIHDNRSNSIGALLMHMAAIEVVQQTWSFENRSLNDTELEKWGDALTLGCRARNSICNYVAEDYICTLADVRNRTLSEFGRRSDAFLYEEVPSKSMNQYCRWFHVVEDEISHRGQIKWIQRRFHIHDLASRR